jgi:hypothetical protein
MTTATTESKKCPHKYKEVSSKTDFEGETYKCVYCGDRYRLYYEDMK